MATIRQSLIAFDEVLDIADAPTPRFMLSAWVLARLRACAAPVSVRASPDAHFLLRRFAEQTGGRVFFPSQAKDLTGVYRRSKPSSRVSMRWPTNPITPAEMVNFARLQFALTVRAWSPEPGRATTPRRDECEHIRRAPKSSASTRHSPAPLVSPNTHRFRASKRVQNVSRTRGELQENRANASGRSRSLNTLRYQALVARSRAPSPT